MDQKLLVADGTGLLGDHVANMAMESGFDVLYVQTREDALFALDNYHFLAFLIDTNLPPENGFEFYDLVKGRLPHPKLIMTTEDNVDLHLDRAARSEVPIILAKPFTKQELIQTLKNLILENQPFGLLSHLEQPRGIKKIRLSKSGQARPAVKACLKQAREWGYEFFNELEIQLVIQEMVINALYHSHNRTSDKEARRAIELEPGQHVDLRFGHDGHRFVITVTDYQGKLTKEKIYNTLLTNLEHQRILASGEVPEGMSMEDIILPRGRGLDMARKLSGEYAFSIQRGKKTEVALIFDSRYDKDDTFSSLKIWEDQDEEK